MNSDLRPDIIAVLEAGKDLTLATLRPDGSPQATTVSYASQGLDIYFGCGSQSQKARNLARDPRVSATIDLPYRDWAEIRGLSLGGRATEITDPEALARAGLLFMEKFPEVAQYVATPAGEMKMFHLRPQVVSVLDYGKGFGHTDLVQIDEPATTDGVS
ncbi:pyridoxamine 5'-phosphate oxidase family protein [Phenylobacterium sp. 20VBR1]|uniref:Pyridoxamine 5'-phosphate oxidase family protein n=1 Tax=Phenylobacterium glaciei TaxID=2803784 RepID=A0A941D1R7_9CAUL|nr:pyridoxamine 5'-phosphate oxidase family protein [Phenylobacterium glaciei]MBR7620571.1 pyridoxamine 5'-phosphate oxidase family protein [Phenylobacterium glaciei]